MRNKVEIKLNNSLDLLDLRLECLKQELEKSEEKLNRLDMRKEIFLFLKFQKYTQINLCYENNCFGTFKLLNDVKLDAKNFKIETELVKQIVENKITGEIFVLLTNYCVLKAHNEDFVKMFDNERITYICCYKEFLVLVIVNTKNHFESILFFSEQKTKKIFIDNKIQICRIGFTMEIYYDSFVFYNPDLTVVFELGDQISDDGPLKFGGGDIDWKKNEEMILIDKFKLGENKIYFNSKVTIYKNYVLVFYGRGWEVWKYNDDKPVSFKTWRKNNYKFDFVANYTPKWNLSFKKKFELLETKNGLLIWSIVNNDFIFYGITAEIKFVINQTCIYTTKYCANKEICYMTQKNNNYYFYYLKKNDITRMII